MPANFEQSFIGCTAQILSRNSLDIMASRAQKLLATSADILVELESHATRSIGTEMMRSRAASAP